jgi:hypothetical protein
MCLQAILAVEVGPAFSARETKNASWSRETVTDFVPITQRWNAGVASCAVERTSSGERWWRAQPTRTVGPNDRKGGASKRL